MKTVYQTDFEGFYTGPTSADPSPLEPGVWLIPGGAVAVEPPALAAGHRARWNGGAWDVIDPPAPPPPTPPSPPTPEEIQRQIAAAIDAHVEAQARTLQYNSAAHLVGYVASTVPDWRAEAEAFVAWRDAVWLTAITKQAEAMQTGTAPSVKDVIEALPKWPGV
jgi:hypothetical protein